MVSSGSDTIRTLRCDGNLVYYGGSKNQVEPYKPSQHRKMKFLFHLNRFWEEYLGIYLSFPSRHPQHHFCHFQKPEFSLMIASLITFILKKIAPKSVNQLKSYRVSRENWAFLITVHLRAKIRALLKIRVKPEALGIQNLK